MKKDYEHRARKRFGQNFLHDGGVISQIARAINAQADQHLVEIGPGKGALTKELLASGCQLDAIELDRDLVAMLKNTFIDQNQFSLHSADALNFDFSQIINPGQQLRVVGNLPYNISTPLILKLLDNAELIEDMYFMLQLEVVNRLAALPGSKAWGRLGVIAQYHCQVENLFEVPPSAFSPAPKVQSAVVKLSPYKQCPYPQVDRDTLKKVVKVAFSQRRKTLRNTLREVVSAQNLEALGIEPSARAETLELIQFIAIANHVSQSEKNQ